ncbi:MAG TPA: leucine--tRNA ligase [Planctomycetota bacterium]|jgi:leucyl-tRNA synthetase|nr:leucine--tRNA ligase [Planctomycetota bacterium]
MPYVPSEIEPKWQAYWDAHQTFRTVIDRTKPKYYALDMFPYPSGAGLHVGHPEGYTATDIICRMKRMQGFNVLHPMGWDAFGLPAERAAVRSGIHPAIITATNTDNFRRQIKRLGFSYDWNREINTSSPDYYRWTQWIFLKLYEAGLAYEAEIPVNWCPALGTVLANEEVSPEGTYKETGDPVEKRLMKQWMLRITAYAQRLIDDLDELDWPEPVKKMQREWIGRSEGGSIRFAVQGTPHTFNVFTTRPDTLFGATYCVLAPEHPLVPLITTDAERAAIDSYRERAGRRSERDRRADTKEKTGAFTGAYAVHPLSGDSLPIWIADYVLASYGSGAIMAVPAHDERDFAFASTMGLPVRAVVVATAGQDPATLDLPYLADGFSCHSEQFSGMSTEACKATILGELESRRVGQREIQYGLRDWLFSRQRYWGEPFPMVRDAKGRCLPVPESDLPVSLPHIEDFRPTDDGRPPLARAPAEWLRVTLKDGSVAERETNTMPQWAGSCWYYLRFLDPRNDKQAWSAEAEAYWMPVDLYIGGTEHAVLHLLYARFWHKVLYDLKLVSTKEPFQKLFNQGMIRAFSFRDAQLKYYPKEDVETREDGTLVARTTGQVLTTQIEKMGKSKFNSVNPDDIIDRYGADAMRIYEMFMGPLDAPKPWQTEGMEGVYRFLGRVWRLFFDDRDDSLLPAVSDVPPLKETDKLRHATIAAVTDDITNLRFNTAVSRMMEMVNHLTGLTERNRGVLSDFIKVLSPFAPHLCEEIWSRMGQGDSLAYEPWPVADRSRLEETELVLPVQINGKMRGRITVAIDATEAEVLAAIRADPSLGRQLGERPPAKVFYRVGKLINLVLGE